MKKEYNKLKEKKGITLIALIVTIVVLLIISGLTVATTVGGDGIIDRIRQAQEDFDEQKDEEQRKIQETRNKLNMVVANIDAGKTATEGNSRYTDGSGKKAIVPQGFTVSGKEGEDSIENGLVIYNTNGQEVTDWDAVDKTTYDQWVWIPVENVNDMYAYSEEGIALCGNTGVKTHYYSKNVTLGTRTLERDIPGNTDGIREPDLNIGDGTQFDEANYDAAGFTSLSNMAYSLVNDYKEMLDSIKKFGGFYIGRYELTGTVENPTEKPGRTLNVSWHESYKACKKFGENNDNIETRIVWCNQWDEICKFIEPNLIKKGYSLDDSRAYGNYTDSIEPANIDGYGSRKNTGSSEYYKVNNIYDLAGNCWEWDQGAYYRWARGNRGGDYGYWAYSDYSSIVKEASTTTTGTLQSLTTRPTMYLKPSSVSTLEQLKSAGTYVDKKTTVKDSNGNKVVIPQGFKVASDSGINVTEGIVIEDNDIIDGIGNNRGNQYVWVPVGNGIKKNDGTSVNITCGRYTFANDGTETLQQNLSNYANNVTIEDYYQEINTPREGTDITDNSERSPDDVNTTALSLENFYNSVTNNGGYYIARYEASYGEKTVNGSTVAYALSKPSANNSTSSWTRNSSNIGMLFNFIRQFEAARASRAIYFGNSNYNITTDLTNSYAWDTAILYIQKFSGDTDYSKQNSLNNSLGNTGRTDETKDERCKINDMSSNLLEWTTEYYIKYSDTFVEPCVSRGDSYNFNNFYTCYRDFYSCAAGYSGSLSFRSILY